MLSNLLLKKRSFPLDLHLKFDLIKIFNFYFLNLLTMKKASSTLMEVFLKKKLMVSNRRGFNKILNSKFSNFWMSVEQTVRIKSVKRGSKISQFKCVQWVLI